MILVIDDDPDVLSILKDKLNEIGDEQVICCETLEGALSVIESVKGITKIYLDVYLPGVNGTDSILQVSKAVEKFALSPKPMIFSMSGDTSKEIKDQSIINGARTFLDKSQLITDQDALRTSYFFEERRNRDNELKDRMSKVESLLWEVSKNTSSLQGQQMNDDRRIIDIQNQVSTNTLKLKSIFEIMEFINKFPLKPWGFLVALFTLLTVSSSVFTELGLQNRVLDYIYNQMPERPIKVPKVSTSNG